MSTIRGLLGLVLCAAACGRFRFDPHGSAGDDANDASDASDGAASSCVTNPLLGASGCLTGTGPYDLWMLADSPSVVVDSSGRGCTPLTSTGISVADGIDVSTGNVAGSATGTIAALMTAKAVTFEVWIRTTATPASNTAIGSISDGASRVGLAQSTTATTGSFDGASSMLLYALVDPRSGAPVQGVVTGNATSIFVSVAGAGGGFAAGSSFAWSPALGTVAFGPWPGTVLRAAVYDRVLSSTELGCLRTAGAATVP